MLYTRRTRFAFSIASQWTRKRTMLACAIGERTRNDSGIARTDMISIDGITSNRINKITCKFIFIRIYECKMGLESCVRRPSPSIRIYVAISIEHNCFNLHIHCGSGSKCDICWQMLKAKRITNLITLSAQCARTTNRHWRQCADDNFSVLVRLLFLFVSSTSFHRSCRSSRAICNYLVVFGWRSWSSICGAIDLFGRRSSCV